MADIDIPGYGRPDRQWSCPSCGRLVVAYDKRREVMHQFPVCAAFAAQVKASGGRPLDAPLVGDVKEGKPDA